MPRRNGTLHATLPPSTASVDAVDRARLARIDAILARWRMRMQVMTAERRRLADRIGKRQERAALRSAA
jgi:hypothetical protein